MRDPDDGEGSGGAERPTLAHCLARASRRLRAAGVETPEVDARLLVAAALGLDPIDLIARPDQPVAAEGERAIDGFIRRRASREPVSRILSRRAFYGRDFLITPATLDPRPDTETLVDLALDIVADEGWRSKPIRILDVGTGSGCILLTLLAELPLATGVGTDIDAAALAAAAANAEALGLRDRVAFALSRSLGEVEGPFDLLVSNPPYIPTGDIDALAPEVRDHDPRTALDGGPDGLDVYRAIISGVPRVVPAGWAAFEVGAGQAPAVNRLLRSHGLEDTRQRVDLGGHTRCVAGRTRGS